ncbi:M48 family metallopeptidase [candidate division KSB1 bacterium]|nr:M48 family metallopeptidase [candidate division KSB1 bacterium]RQW11444.1 MAG: M48 family peptidase [candidate division KSB1 bacterium]
MNLYGIIILATIAFDYALSQIADLLNLRNMTTTLPTEFSGFYDDEKYQKSQRYLVANTRLGFLTNTVDVVVLLLFWFLGGFNWLDALVRGLDLPVIPTGLLYMAILVFAKSLISLPFDVYDTFVLEQRFGFNKTTLKTFILDRIKGALLGVLIGGPLMALVLAIFAYLGSSAWLVGWGVVTVVSLIISYIAPVWIMPLFNKFEPLAEGELRSAIMNYATSVDYALAGIFQMDGSKRSSKSNAFFTGFGKNKRIALFDTLIAQHTIKEMVAILAHEIGHYKKKHVISRLITGILHSGLMFFLLSIFISHRGLFDAFYMENVSVYAGFIFFGLLYSPMELLLSLGSHYWSRRQEYQADRFACETTQDSEAMITALKKLTVNNLGNLTPHPFYVFLNYTHPPVLQRIEAMRGLNSGPS